MEAVGLFLADSTITLTIDDGEVWNSTYGPVNYFPLGAVRTMTAYKFLNNETFSMQWSTNLDFDEQTSKFTIFIEEVSISKLLS